MRLLLLGGQVWLLLLVGLVHLLAHQSVLQQPFCSWVWCQRDRYKVIDEVLDRAGLACVPELQREQQLGLLSVCSKWLHRVCMPNIDCEGALAFMVQCDDDDDDDECSRYHSVGSKVLVRTWLRASRLTDSFLACLIQLSRSLNSSCSIMYCTSGISWYSWSRG